MVDFDCIAARVVPGQTDSIAGQFTLDGNQLHWAPLDPANGQSFRVALEAVKGALQKARSKPQMRVSTISGPLMLEFASMEERDAAIAQITPLLSRKSAQPGQATEPTGPLAATKKQLLEENKDLRNLYSELVKGGLVTDAEFWKPRQDIVLRAAGGAAGKQQVIGLSSALLAQLQPTADGKKQVTMTITPQFIQQVFAEKPHVHRAFVENVPQKMDDKEFWTRFAKYEIQIQERRKAGAKRTHEPPDPLFSKLAPENVVRLDNDRIDPTVNLAVDTFDNSITAPGVDTPSAQGHSNSIAHDMNRHSAVVLKGPGAFAQQSSSGPEQDGNPQAQEEDWRRRGSSALEDLRASREADSEALHIRNPRRYFERGAQDAPGATDAGRSVSRAEIVESLTDPAARLSMDPIAAEQVLQDMQRDSSSALPDTWVTNMNANVLVPQMQTMLRQSALVCNDLLRLFWSCLPVRASATREKRATKLKEALDQRYTQLEHMQDAAQASDRALIAQLLGPVKQAIDAALEAYQAEMGGVRGLAS